MQIVFDMIGRCKDCIHFDGLYKPTGACGGCERNPKVKNLKDCFEKPKVVKTTIEVSKLPEAPPDDASRATELENDEALADMGILPAAQRRAIRQPAKSNDQGSPPTG